MISVPTLATALHTDMLGISWALIVYQMAGIGLGVICGRLGDIHGHHKTYAVGMWVMAAASLLCGFSQNIWQLILFRFLHGIGAALCMITARAATVEPARQQKIDYSGGLLLFALTVFATLLLDQKVAQMFGGGSQLFLGALFLAALWYFLRQEKRVTSPLVDLS